MGVGHRKPERDRVAIVAEILEMARFGILKTNIMYRAGMSSLMLNRYLGLMMNAKLLDVALLNDKVMLKATDRGVKFLYHCYEIKELLEPEDDGHKPCRRIQLLPISLHS
jgi:predicted transcriptional regulator